MGQTAGFAADHGLSDRLLGKCIRNQVLQRVCGRMGLTENTQPVLELMKEREDYE